MRKIGPRNTEAISVANEYYEAMRKEDRSHEFNIRMAERMFGLNAGQLTSYRSNHRRMKGGTVKLVYHTSRAA